MTKKVGFIKDFLNLTKAEIVLLEAITLIAGFWIGRPLEIPVAWNHFFLALFGTTFLAMGAGALNQIQERHDDIKMERTRNRPLPSGRVSLSKAISITLLLFTIGLYLLNKVSWNVLLLGAFAVISYNGLYTMWWKRKMAFAAIPGAIPGAIPVLIGYQAALAPSENAIGSAGGYYLFALLIFWQMPHFWVLALKYSNDYKKGGFPTLPVAHGPQVTRYQITLWCLAYCGIGVLAALFFPLGLFGILGCLATSIGLLFELFRFLSHPEQKTWLRFFLSINFSLILYLGIIATDLLLIHLQPMT